IELEEGEVGFQDYFVRRRHQVAVLGIRLAGVESAEAAPGVLDAIAEAELVIICPSNPLVSIGPVLATGGIGPALAARRETVAAVSPIVGGRAIKGPADRMLVELGHESSVVGVARMWAPYASLLAIDPVDAPLGALVSEAGMRPLVTPSVMHTPVDAAALARAVLSAMGGAGVAAGAS
ncbi:MAG: 2-phospho-L-lactate transferase CofD family protein, partial [Acidimicrobiales bacterium]